MYCDNGKTSALKIYIYQEHKGFTDNAYFFHPCIYQPSLSNPSIYRVCIPLEIYRIQVWLQTILSTNGGISLNQFCVYI